MLRHLRDIFLNSGIQKGISFDSRQARHGLMRDETPCTSCTIRKGPMVNFEKFLQQKCHQLANLESIYGLIDPD